MSQISILRTATLFSMDSCTWFCGLGRGWWGGSNFENKKIF